MRMCGMSNDFKLPVFWTFHTSLKNLSLFKEIQTKENKLNYNICMETINFET